MRSRMLKSPKAARRAAARPSTAPGSKPTPSSSMVSRTRVATWRIEISTTRGPGVLGDVEEQLAGPLEEHDLDVGRRASSSPALLLENGGDAVLLLERPRLGDALERGLDARAHTGSASRSRR